MPSDQFSSDSRAVFQVAVLMSRELQILFEDNHLLVMDKPPGLATMGTGDTQTAHALACDYIKQKYHKPGKVYLGVVHRLDSMTSGVLIFARTSKAAARLSEQFRRGAEKIADASVPSRSVATGPGKAYLAILQTDAAKPELGVSEQLADRGTLRDWLVKNEREHRMQVVSAGSRGAVEAVLDYERLGRLNRSTTSDSQRLSNGPTLHKVTLRTGRKHQIRVQFAHRGLPVWGDVKYGGKRQSGLGIGLHAWRLSILHPTTKTEMVFESPVPEAWLEKFPTIASCCPDVGFAKERPNG